MADYQVDKFVKTFSLIISYIIKETSFLGQSSIFGKKSFLNYKTLT
jgi:hypothetical protein